MLTSDIGPHFWPYFFSGLPWEKPEEYLAKSPISMVDQVTTPTMLLTGEQDFRTPMSEAEQFYQGLQMRGVDTALVRIQSSSHSIAKTPSNLLRKVSYVLGWFERYRQSERVVDGGGADKYVIRYYEVGTSHYEYVSSISSPGIIIVKPLPKNAL